MKNTENSSNLNPEIKATAEKLFNLLAEERENNSTASEDMSKQMEDVLQGRGADELYGAILAARTASQNASNNLEESTWYMNDETLETIHELAKNAQCLSEDEINVHTFNRILESFKKLCPQVLQRTRSEFQHRCMSYGKELKG